MSLMIIIIRSTCLLTLLLYWFPHNVKAGFPIWGTKPILSYFALTASLEGPLRQGARLNPSEYRIIESIAQQESSQLRELDRISQAIIADPDYSLMEKRRKITALGYNQKVDAVVYRTDQQLRKSLSLETYGRLIHWIEQRWQVEVRRHGRISVPSARSAAARTYEIFATRYESKGGAYTVALPDKCAKFANGGLHTCDRFGYLAGGNYSVAIRYKQGAAVIVGEAGPWNIDDTFWASTSDPTPRRMFTDLAVGMPEAQAAYFNGYNGGTDQYGRKVTAPFAIDLAFQVGDDIGLPAKKNDWITVSFLWTDSWGTSSSNTGKQSVQSTEGNPISASTTANVIPQVATAAPEPDGSITHVVKAGETLWAIAVAYNLRVAQIQFLNNLGQKIVIFEGQKLKIKEAGATWTQHANFTTLTDIPDGTATPTQPVQAGITQTKFPADETPSIGLDSPSAEIMNHLTKTPEPTEIALASVTSPDQNDPTLDGQGRSSGNNLLIGSILLAAGGLLLILMGWLFNKSKDSNTENDIHKNE